MIMLKSMILYTYIHNIIFKKELSLKFFASYNHLLEFS